MERMKMDLKKVLVVDDEKIIRDGLCQYVNWEEHGAFLFGCAENGVEALKIIEQNDIDILITDIRMPNMDGLELIGNLAGLGKCPVTILISGYNDFSYTQKAIKLKIVFDYILKPIDIKELEQTLQMAVRERERLLKQIVIPVLSPEDWNRYLGNKRINYAQLQKEILANIKQGKLETALSNWSTIWESLLQNKHSLDCIKRCCWELAMNIISTVIECGLNEYAVIFKEDDPLCFIATKETLDDIKEYTDHIIKESCRYMASGKKMQMSALIKSAIGMIEQHYADPNFNLQWVAAQTMVTPNYLSTQFKEELGIGFVRYLNSVRIDKAKELLKNTFLKIYEISDRTGIEDVHYFARLFSEYTGLTPKEYRRSMKKVE
jgi:two-component system response regulator YesN